MATFATMLIQRKANFLDFSGSEKSQGRENEYATITPTTHPGIRAVFQFINLFTVMRGQSPFMREAELSTTALLKTSDDKNNNPQIRHNFRVLIRRPATPNPPIKSTIVDIKIRQRNR